MAVAHDAATEFSTFTTGDGGGTHTPSGTPRAVVVKVVHGDVSTDLIDSAIVDYGGVAMERVMTAVDTATEAGRSYIYFLGAGIPTGAQTVTIRHNGATTTKWATCETMTASADCEVSAAGGVNENVSSPAVRLYKPRSGMAHFAIYSGLAAPSDLTAPGSVTAINDHDFGNFVARSDRETSPSSGDQLFTWTTGVSDDTALCAVSISEIASSSPRHLSTSVANAQNATTTVSFKMGGHLIGRRLVVHVISRDHTSGTAVATISDDSGANSWSADRAGDADRKIYVFEKEGALGDVGATVTIAGAVGSVSAQMTSWMGVTALQNMAVETNASGDETHATMDPTSDGALAVLVIGDYGNDTNAVTSPSGATTGALAIVGESLSTGGSDCRLTTAWDIVPSGATGSVTWSQTNSTTKSALYSLPPATPQTLTGGPADFAPAFTPGTLVQGVTLSGGPANFAPVFTPGTVNVAFPGDLPSAAVIAIYDARLLAGSDTDPVSSWPDVGPGGEDPLAQGTGANQPTIDDDGFDSVRSVLFDGSNDHMFMELAGSYTEDFAIIIALELMTYPTGSATVAYSTEITGGITFKNILGVDDAEAPPGWVTMSGDGSAGEHHHGTADQAYLEGTPSRFVMTQMIENDNRLRLWENNTLVIDEAPASAGDLNNLAGLRVGAREDISRFMHCRIGYVLLVDMTETDVATLLAARDQIAEWFNVDTSLTLTGGPADFSPVFNSGTLAPGGVTVSGGPADFGPVFTPGALAASNTLSGGPADFSPVFTPGTLTPGGVTVTGGPADFGPVFTPGAVLPGGVTVTGGPADFAPTFAPGVLAASYTLTGGPADFAPVFTPGVLAAGGVTVTGGPADFAPTFHTGTLAPGGVTVSGGPADFSPVFTPGALAASYVLSGGPAGFAPTFHTGSITSGTTLTGGPADFAPTFHTGTLTPGGVTVSGGPADFAPVFTPGVVTTGTVLTGGPADFAPTFHTGTLAPGGVTVTGGPADFAPVFIPGFLTPGAVAVTGAGPFLVPVSFLSGVLGSTILLTGGPLTLAPTFIPGTLTGGPPPPTFWEKDPAGYTPDPSGFTRTPVSYVPAARDEPSPW